MILTGIVPIIKVLELKKTGSPEENNFESAVEESVRQQRAPTGRE